MKDYENVQYFSINKIPSLEKMRHRDIQKFTERTNSKMKMYVCVLTRGDKNITNMSCQHVKLQNEFHKLLLGMKQRQHLTLAHNYSYQMCPFLKGRT